MTTGRARDEGSWAKPVDKLHVGHDLPPEALNLNVEGKRVAGIAGGFGKMWQKTYTVRISSPGLSPQAVIAAWKQNFPSFWPKGANFFGPMAGVTPGDVALLNLKGPGGVKLSTGIIVVYADDESFSFMSPEGHMFNGMITFSARADGAQTDGAGAVIAKADALIRAQDPIYELGMIFGGHRKEDVHWLHTLEQLAAHFGVVAKAEAARSLVDKRRQWKNFGNVRRSAALRSGIHALGAPIRAAKRPFKRVA